MGKEPNQIRDEIDETRSRIDDTVDAIGYKADVPNRMRDAVNDRVSSAGDTVKSGVSSVKEKLFGAASSVQDAVSSRTSQAAGRMGDALDATRSAGQETVRRGLENPIGMAVGAAAIGFLAGMLMPVSDVERERISPIAGDLKERAIESVKEQGQNVASTLLSNAGDLVGRNPSS